MEVNQAGIEIDRQAGFGFTKHAAGKKAVFQNIDLIRKLGCELSDDFAFDEVALYRDDRAGSRMRQVLRELIGCIPGMGEPVLGFSPVLVIGPVELVWRDFQAHAQLIFHCRKKLYSAVTGL